MAFVGVNRRGGTKFNWNKQQLRQLIGDAAAEALQKAGLLVRRNTQRGMVGGSTTTGRASRKTPVFRQYGEKDGYPVVGAIFQVPRPDKVSTWAPRAWLRNDILSDWDHSTKSVVVGPSKTPWLNQLHEFGGTEQYWVATPPWPRTDYQGHKLPKRMMANGKQGRNARGQFTRKKIGAYVGYVTNRPLPGGIYIGSRTLRGRGYMEIGLQASLHKIPQQFHNAITRGS